MAVVRRRSTPGGVDAYGDPLPSTTADTTLTGAFVAPRMSDPVDARGRDGVVVGLTLFTAHGADLDRVTDRIIVTGEGANNGTYTIDGEPGDWRQPQTGWKAGQATALTRAEG